MQSGRGGDDEVSEDVVAEAERGSAVFELGDDDVDGGESVIGHDYAEDYHGDHIKLFGSLRSISHWEDELCTDEQYAAVSKDDKDYLANTMTKRIEFGVTERTGDKVES